MKFSRYAEGVCQHVWLKSWPSPVCSGHVSEPQVPLHGHGMEVVWPIRMKFSEYVQGPRAKLQQIMKMAAELEPVEV